MISKSVFYYAAAALIVFSALPASLLARSPILQYSIDPSGNLVVDLKDSSNRVEVTDEDTINLEKLPPAVDLAVRKFYSAIQRKVEWDIGAARTAGNYIYLWIDEPAVRNGGENLLYSIKEKKIIGRFFAGYGG